MEDGPLFDGGRDTTVEGVHVSPSRGRGDGKSRPRHGVEAYTDGRQVQGGV